MPHNGINKGRKRDFKKGVETKLFRKTIPVDKETKIIESIKEICKNDFRE